MPHSPSTIANYFLDKASDEQRALTPMQLIKLVYIAHGWHLAYFDRPLIGERIQAWKFGPVIETLYQQLKRFGSGPVAGRISMLPWISNTPIDEQIKPLLDSVWNAYKGFNGLQLSSMTHQKGTPWHEAWHSRGGYAAFNAPISDDEIKAHYKNKIAAAPTAP